MPKITLEQKRLEQLRRQLYGKERDTVSIKKQPEKTSSSNSSHSYSLAAVETLPGSSQSVSLDINYLKKDLLKIVSLSATALAAQLLLYFSLQMKIFHLGF